MRVSFFGVTGGLGLCPFECCGSAVIQKIISASTDGRRYSILRLSLPISRPGLDSSAGLAIVFFAADPLVIGQPCLGILDVQLFFRLIRGTPGSVGLGARIHLFIS
jgi:hypothetical protein